MQFLDEIVAIIGRKWFKSVKKMFFYYVFIVLNKFLKRFFYHNEQVIKNVLERFLAGVPFAEKR